MLSTPHYLGSFPRPELFSSLTTKSSLPNRFGYRITRLCSVDYVDAFGQRHRGGYGRMFVADQQENNLVFMPNTFFNFGVIRQPGEGKNWEESF